MHQREHATTVWSISEEDLLAENLKHMRKVCENPQVLLADAAGIDRGSISDTENSRYGISIDKLGSLAAELGVENWELLHPDTRTKCKIERCD